MLIRELSRPESVALLARARLGRLACARENQPYVVPTYFAYDDDFLYSFSTAGQKIDWMRVNPNVCFEVDEVASPQQWTSVIVLGRYEEMPDVPQWRAAREYAHQKLVQRNAIWWEPAYARTILGEQDRPLAPSFYRIRILQISGHRATPEHAASTGASSPSPETNRAGWLGQILRRVGKQA